MERILVVDDSKDIVTFIKDMLEDAGYEVITAYDGEEAMNKLYMKPDLMLLDIMMPKIDGLELCRRIRDDVECPIIFLTARETEADKVKSFGVGADDYIVKPFGVDELLARIEAHLRRQKRLVSGERKVISFDGLNIDLKGRTVSYKGENISLTTKEFDIVELLVLNVGQVFTKENIYEKIWGWDAEGDSALIAEHVKKIRAKFVNTGVEKNYIATVWGVGYKWEK